MNNQMLGWRTCARWCGYHLLKSNALEQPPPRQA
jgi:hypothetical protein